jgi:hypothetical protein
MLEYSKNHGASSKEINCPVAILTSSTGNVKEVKRE